MPINPQIPLAVQQLNIDPMQQMGRALQLKHMMAQTNALDAQNQRQQQLVQMIRGGAKSKDLMQAGFTDEAAKLGAMEKAQYERSRQAAEDAYKRVVNSPDPQQAWQEEYMRLASVVEDKEAFFQNFPREWNENTAFMVMLAAAPEEERPSILAAERERRAQQGMPQQGMAQQPGVDPRNFVASGGRVEQGLHPTVAADRMMPPETTGGMFEGPQPRFGQVPTQVPPGALNSEWLRVRSAEQVARGLPPLGEMSNEEIANRRELEMGQFDENAPTIQHAGFETNYGASAPVPQQPARPAMQQPAAQPSSGMPSEPQYGDDPLENSKLYTGYLRGLADYYDADAAKKEAAAEREGLFQRDRDRILKSADRSRERAKQAREEAQKLGNYTIDGQPMVLHERFAIGQNPYKPPLATATASATSKQEGKSEVDLAYDEAIKAFEVSRSVRQSIPGLQSLWDLSNETLINLGPGADALQFLDRIADRFGGGEDNKERVANTRRAMQQFAQFTLDAREKLKGQGQISDKETQLLVDASSGKIDEFTADEIKALVGALAKINLQAWDEANEALDIEIQLATPSEGNPGKPLLLRRLKAYKERLGERPNIVVRKGKIKSGPNAGKTAVMHIDGTMSILEGDK